MILENFPENLIVNEPENEQKIDSVSARLHDNTDTIRDDYRSLLNSNNRGNSKVTIESDEELNSQMSRKLEEIKMGLGSQILAAINTHITEKVIPELQESIGVLDNGTNTNWTKSQKD